ncbi:hypothetical protein GDO78_010864 [Eleutherodactylus coqui]|uniref:Secreted protein n=1 Tax=Eleutherodactylus coqui TaxID=57060 RepID=A0A8J6F877_ELECQ|nr:hypothetical protein GDO78_010864 [Eleutherodactylus coqui]
MLLFLLELNMAIIFSATEVPTPSPPPHFTPQHRSSTFLTYACMRTREYYCQIRSCTTHVYFASVVLPARGILTTPVCRINLHASMYNTFYNPRPWPCSITSL